MTESMTCKRCGAELDGMPELTGAEWSIDCLDCGVKNIVVLALAVVAWRR